MYKYHHLLPSSFDNYFVLNSLVHDHNTRSSTKNNYYLPTVNTNIRKFCIKFAGPSVWNNIPTHIKSLASLASVKHTLKDLLKSNY